MSSKSQYVKSMAAIWERGWLTSWVRKEWVTVAAFNCTFYAKNDALEDRQGRSRLLHFTVQQDFVAAGCSPILI